MMIIFYSLNLTRIAKTWTTKKCHVRLMFFSPTSLFVFVCDLYACAEMYDVWVVPFYLRVEVKRSRNDSLRTILNSIFRKTFDLFRMSSEFRSQSTEHLWLRVRTRNNEQTKKLLLLALIQIFSVTCRQNAAKWSHIYIYFCTISDEIIIAMHSKIYAWIH